MKNVIFVGAGVAVGTVLIYAVSASPVEHTYNQDIDGDGYESNVATTTLLEIAPTGFVASSSDFISRNRMVKSNDSIKPLKESISGNIAAFMLTT